MSLAVLTAALLVLLLDGCGDERTDDTGSTDADGDGWTVAEGDCDDADPAVNPSAVDSCGDGVDDDCDGSDASCWQNGVLDLAGADATFVGAEDEFRLGSAIASGDFDGDGHDDVLVGEPHLVKKGRGAVYLVGGPAYGTLDPVRDAAGAVLEEEDEGDRAGSALATGDLDGDGFDDVLVGANSDDEGGLSAGAVFVVTGPLSGSLDLTSADAKLVGEDGGDWAGRSLAAGDIDGDGSDDVLLGAPWADTDVDREGAAYVVRGPVSGTLDLAGATAKLLGAEYEDVAGTAVASGDLDGDGNDDVIVGAPGLGSEGYWKHAGTVHVVFGPVAGVLDLADAEVYLKGDERAWAGTSLATGDIDGDGSTDLLVSELSVTWVLDGPVTEDGFLGSRADGHLWGMEGTTATGDVDADGRDDILVGDENHQAAFVVLGPVSGTVDASAADAQMVVENPSSVVTVATGDMDGDGLQDVLIGAPAWDESGIPPGRAYLVYGGW